MQQQLCCMQRDGRVSKTDTASAAVCFAQVWVPVLLQQPDASCTGTVASLFISIHVVHTGRITIM